MDKHISTFRNVCFVTSGDLEGKIILNHQVILLEKLYVENHNELATCPVCGKKISILADNCPNCGRPRPFKFEIETVQASCGYCNGSGKIKFKFRDTQPIKVCPICNGGGKVDAYKLTALENNMILHDGTKLFGLDSK